MNRIATALRTLACCGLLLLAGRESWAAEPLPFQESWIQEHAPFKIFGNSYYVGTYGLSSVLITSDQGHILIDGGLPQSPAIIAAHIKTLGFKVEDIKLILNSHTHFDHAGGIAELQKLSGAKVAASRIAAAALERGRGETNDPQYESVGSFPPIKSVQVLEDGKSLRVGSTEITIHYTPGHTPGGSSWTWKSCEKDRCLNMVYADSLNPVSDKNFRFSGGPRWPNVQQDFIKAIATMEALPCDIIVAAHPDFVDLWTRLDQRTAGKADALVDTTACRRYATAAREKLDARVASEKKN